MGGLFGMGGGESRSVSTFDKMVAGMRFQTSAFGLSWTLLFGRNRITGNLVDYQDFIAIPHTETQTSGGGGGGGKGGSTPTQTSSHTSYTYQVALALGLIAGPVASDVLKGIWLGKERKAVTVFELMAGNSPQEPWSYMVSNHPERALGYHGLVCAVAPSFDLGDSGSLPNIGVEMVGLHPYDQPIDVVDYEATLAGPAVGGLVTVTVPEHLHFVSDNGVKDSLDAPLTESGSGDPGSGEYRDEGNGTYSFSELDIGQTVKISYTYNQQWGAIADDILKYIWNNSFCGLGQGLLKLGDWTDFRNFCLANNWQLSPFLTAQEEAKGLYERILDMTNSVLAWREGMLDIIPLGDTQVAGNGVIWMPNLSSLYSLDTSHFLVDDRDSMPVRWDGDTPQDAYNHVRVEFLNKDNEYNVEPAEYKDEANIEDYGLKTDPTTYKFHEITFKEMAQQVAQIKVNKNLFQPGAYEFQLPWHFGRYDPGDIVDLTDLGLSLKSKPVRITKKTVAVDGCYTFRAVPLDIGSATPGSHDVPEGEGEVFDYGVEPGNVNAPVIFVPPIGLMESEMEVWAAISGGQYWGGCNIWISESGDNYKYVGQVVGKARHGTLSASLPASAVSPDTVNTLSVDLTGSRGVLLSGTQQDAEQYNTLCKVGDEYLAYKTATLTSQYNYDLTWLVRGAYGSGMALRLVGSEFVRLDKGLFKYLCKRVDIGKTIYIKFQSFNIHLLQAQDLADLDPYEFVITNPGDQGTEPVVGLTVGNDALSPNTKVDVAFNSCPTYDTLGSKYVAGALGFTINAGAVGVNGLDSGSLAAASLYYYYAIANAATGAVGGLLSLSGSSPAMPSGYTHKRLLGVVYTDISAHFVEFSQVDYEWLYGNVQSLANGITAQSWTDQDASGLIPPISTRGKFSLLMENEESAGLSFGLRRNGSTATLGQVYGTCLPGASAQVNDWCDTDVSQVVELNVDNDIIWNLYVAGFYLTI